MCIHYESHYIWKHLNLSIYYLGKMSLENTKYISLYLCTTKFEIETVSLRLSLIYF